MDKGYILNVFYLYFPILAKAFNYDKKLKCFTDLNPFLKNLSRYKKTF